MNGKTYTGIKGCTVHIGNSMCCSGTYIAVLEQREALLLDWLCRLYLLELLDYLAFIIRKLGRDFNPHVHLYRPHVIR